MSEINANIVISPIDLGVTVNTNQLSFTPESIGLNFYTGGVGVPGGLTGELQYNNGGILGGASNTSYSGGNLTLGNVSNIKITGGSANFVLFTDGTGNLSWASIANANYANFANYAGNAFNVNAASTSNVIILGGINGYVLQTDGTGNLTWTAQTGNGGGNGTPGGSNTQVQYNDAGSFGGNVGFTFNEVTGNLNVPVLSVAGISNLNSNSNVKITGGSNNQVLTTDGAGNLSWSTTGGGNWSNVSNIIVGDLFFGIYAASNTSIGPGNTVAITSTLNSNSFSIANTGYANGVLNLGSTDNYIWALRTGPTSNIARSDSTGTSWSTVAVPFSDPTQPPLQAGNNIVIWKSATNSAAYSSNDGTSWTTSNTARGTLNLGQGAYGNGVIIISGSEVTNNNFIKSTDYGVTWSNSNTGSNTSGARAIAYGNSKFITLYDSSNVAKITTNNGNSWSNINVGNTYLWRSLAYGNGKWVGVSEFTGATNRGAAIVSSNDGTTWTTTLLANSIWNDITYTNGYFVAAEFDGNVITSVDGITWTTANTALGSSNGGSLAYNNTDNLLIVGSRGPTGSSNVAVALTPKISITSADGNSSNSSIVPIGSYKNLGGAIGNVGAMWTRTA